MLRSTAEFLSQSEYRPTISARTLGREAHLQEASQEKTQEQRANRQEKEVGSPQHEAERKKEEKGGRGGRS
jgi:hypothetical protein